MTKVFFTALFLVFTLITFAQKTVTAPALANQLKFDLGFQGYGFAYEAKTSKNITTDLAIGAGGAYQIEPRLISYNFNLFKPALYLSVTPKLYYNRNVRARKEKKTSLNSGNYFGLRLKYASVGSRYGSPSNAAMLTNFHWGLQRAISKNWNMNAHIGIGIAQDIELRNGTVYPAIDLKFSYVIVK